MNPQLATRLRHLRLSGMVDALRDMERLAIQQWVAEKFAKRTGWQTVRNSWVLLSGILESAVEYGYLQTNPARGVKFPRRA